MPPPLPRKLTQLDDGTNPFAQLQAAFSSLTPSILLADNAIRNLSQTPFAALQRGISAIQSQIVQFVQFANPAAVIQFRLAWESLQGVIGQSLTPVLQSFTVIIQQLANYLNATDSSGKALIAVLAVLGVVTGVVIGGITGMSAALVVFKLAMDVATGGLTAIASAIGLVVGGLTAAGSLTVAFSPLNALKGIANSVGPPIMMFVQMIGSLVEAFASGVVPGIISALDSLGEALKVVLSSFGDGGELFKTLGEMIGTSLQMVALSIQFGSYVFQSFASVFKSLVQILSSGVDVVGLFSGGLENLMVWLKAASMILAGNIGGQNDGPGKAPPGARQATSQNISSFITKSYVSALQGGTGGEQGFRNGVIQNLAEINKKAGDIYVAVQAYIDTAANIAKQVAAAPNGAVDNIAGVAAAAANPVGAAAENAWAAGRALVNRVVGK